MRPYIYTKYYCALVEEPKEKLFCAWIDFAKLFDNVQRIDVCICIKLIKYEITGKMFRIIIYVQQY